MKKMFAFFSYGSYCAMLLCHIFIFCFIFIPAFPFGRVAGQTASGGLETPHGQKQSHIVLLWMENKTGPSKVGCVITPRCPWTTSGPPSRRCNQQALPRQSSLRHSAHMTKPM